MIKYGVPAIAKCIGPNGMAKTTKKNWKLHNSYLKQAKNMD